MVKNPRLNRYLQATNGHDTAVARGSATARAKNGEWVSDQYPRACFPAYPEKKRVYPAVARINPGLATVSVLTAPAPILRTFRLTV